MNREIAVDFTIDSARSRPASAFSRVRARNTVGMPAAANTAPLPDPMAPLAPRITTLRIGFTMLQLNANRGEQSTKIRRAAAPKWLWINPFSEFNATSQID